MLDEHNLVNPSEWLLLNSVPQSNRNELQTFGGSI